MLDSVGPDINNAPVIQWSRGRRTFAAALCVPALAGWDRALAQGCAMCATALKGGDDPLTRSLAISSILLLSMPFTLFASVAGYFWLRHRRRAADQIAIQTEAPAEEALR